MSILEFLIVNLGLYCHKNLRPCNNYKYEYNLFRVKSDEIASAYPEK
jgi:hypothetical protein